MNGRKNWADATAHATAHTVAYAVASISHTPLPLPLYTHSCARVFACQSGNPLGSSASLIREVTA